MYSYLFALKGRGIPLRASETYLSCSLSRRAQEQEWILGTERQIVDTAAEEQRLISRLRSLQKEQRSAYRELDAVLTASRRPVLVGSVLPAENGIKQQLPTDLVDRRQPQQQEDKQQQQRRPDSAPLQEPLKDRELSDDNNKDIEEVEEEGEEAMIETMASRLEAMQVGLRASIALRYSDGRISSCLLTPVLPQTIQATEDLIADKFAKFDPDGTGFVSGDDLGELLKSLGEDLTEEQLQQAREQLEDANGSISFGEFLLWWNG